jgi:glycosyltransferase involved in cell wall biosynthesis
MMPDKTPTISIITVVFNGKETLEKTITSVSAQTYRNIEYIVVDGNSNDGTVEIIKNNSGTISRWISEPDNGLYDAMNKGLKMAKGDYIWFVNAGDQIYNAQTLEKIFGKAPDLHADIYYGEVTIIDSNGNEIGMRRQKLPEKLTWKSLKMGMVVSHQAFIVKRSLAPFYNLQYKYSSDIDWVICSLKSSKNTLNTKQVLSKFLDGGRSKQTIIPSLRERFIIMAQYYGLIPTIMYHFPIAFKFLVFLIRNKRF